MFFLTHHRNNIRRSGKVLFSLCQFTSGGGGGEGGRRSIDKTHGTFPALPSLPPFPSTPAPSLSLPWLKV